MQPIQEPELLNPDRIVDPERGQMTADDHRDRAEQYKSALHESCEYAKQVWHQLDDTRAYLRRCLPDDPSKPGARRFRTAPVDANDEQGWQDWMRTYADVTSVLAGPRGDSGFGEEEARAEARSRRVHLPMTDQLPDQPEADPAVLHAEELAAQTSAHPDAAPEPPGLREQLIGPVAIGALVLLALRGLRPRRSTQ
jgi:hypothetical protein